MASRTGQQWQTHLLGHHEFREIPVDKLFVDQEYQRDLNEGAIKRYVGNYDPNLFEPLTVNERKNGNGSVFALLDGQHRRVIAQKLGVRAVTCRVLHVDHDTEASLFVRLNKERVYLSPVQAFKAELAAGNPSCVEIAKVLETRELEIGKTRNTHTVNAVTALLKIYSRGGFVGLARVLDVAILGWPEDETSRFSGQILLGLDAFLGETPHPDINKVAEKLAKTTPDRVLAQANSRWHGHRAVGETQKSVVNCITEVIQKIYRATGQRS